MREHSYYTLRRVGVGSVYARCSARMQTMGGRRYRLESTSWTTARLGRCPIGRARRCWTMSVWPFSAAQRKA